MRCRKAWAEVTRHNLSYHFLEFGGALMSKSILRQFIDNYWPQRDRVKRDSHYRKLEYYRLRADGVVANWPEYEEYERRRDQEDEQRANPG